MIAYQELLKSWDSWNRAEVVHIFMLLQFFVKNGSWVEKHKSLFTKGQAGRNELLYMLPESSCCASQEGGISWPTVIWTRYYTCWVLSGTDVTEMDEKSGFPIAGDGKGEKKIYTQTLFVLLHME